MAQPVNHFPIPVPFTGRLDRPLGEGQIVHVQGRVKEHAKKLEFNLLQGGPDLDHGAVSLLHLNFRYGEKTLVLNSNAGGRWGNEERIPLPFEPGHLFDLTIRVHGDRYQIFGNGNELFHFNHRANYNSVEYFQAKGDLELSKVNWHGYYYNVPFETQFKGAQLKIRDQVHLTVTPRGERFEINLLSRNGESYFHLNPRFKEKKVVKNTQQNGKWGTEDRSGEFPFLPNVPTDVVLINEPYGISVLVNNVHYYTYNHRVEQPATDYAGIQVKGEVELTNFEVFERA